jgi:parallel beta-helix repeat protein
MRRLQFLFLISTFLLVSAAQAGTYYVATTGSNTTGNGSITNPWATVSYAVQTGTVYGDLTNNRGATIYVRGGIYYGPVAVWVSGTSTGRLIIQAYPDEHPIFDGSANMGTTTDVVTIGGAYTDFIGFEIRNSPHVGYDGWGQTYGRILNNTIHDSQGDAIYIGHDTAGGVHDIVISGNTIYHNCLSNQARTNTSGGWPQTIGVNACANTTVSYNRIFRNYGEGIILGYTDNSSIVGNEVFDNYAVEIYLEHARTTVVDGNFCYSYDPDYYRNLGSGTYRPADGISIANEHVSPASTHTLANDDIINNVVLHAHWGLGYWRDDAGISNVRWANNSVYDATSDALHIDYDLTASGNIVENNIFALSSGSSANPAGALDLSGNPTTTLQSTGMTYRYNLWSTAPPSPAHTTSNNDQVGTPGFVKPGGHDVNDYKLTSTALAKDHGSTLSYVTIDLTRKTRSGTYELGAYEY